MSLEWPHPLSGDWRQFLKMPRHRHGVASSGINSAPEPIHFWNQDFWKSIFYLIQIEFPPLTGLSAIFQWPSPHTPGFSAYPSCLFCLGTHFFVNGFDYYYMIISLLVQVSTHRPLSPFLVSVLWPHPHLLAQLVSPAAPATALGSRTVTAHRDHLFLDVSTSLQCAIHVALLSVLQVVFQQLCCFTDF